MRTIIAVFCALIILVLSPVLWLFLLIIRLFSRKASDLIAVNFIRVLARFLKVLAGTRLTVRGRENIPKDRAVVYALNHRSVFDIVLTYPLTYGRMGYVAKKELSKVPIFSTWLWFVNCLFLDRKDIREGVKTINKAIDNVKNGISMGIFPEGTRNRDKEHLNTLAEFHAASFKIATKTNAPIIPVAIYNSAECMENHMPWLKSTPVQITFGKPIILDELDPEERKFIGKTVQAKVQEMLDEQERIAKQ